MLATDVRPTTRPPLLWYPTAGSVTTLVDDASPPGHEPSVADLAASERDAAADKRDAAADKRDAAADLLDIEILATALDSGWTDDGAWPLHMLGSDHALDDRARAAEDRAAAAADRAHAAKALRMSHLDMLTGVFGRAMGHQILVHELQRAERQPLRFVLAFIDVDGLKAVNDRHGHDAGDTLLRAVAQALREHVRPYDPIVRWGGDEFLVGLAGLPPEAARGRFSAVRERLAACAAATISSGIAVWDGDETLERLIVRADAALRDVRKAASA